MPLIVNGPGNSCFRLGEWRGKSLIPLLVTHIKLSNIVGNFLGSSGSGVLVVISLSKRYIEDKKDRFQNFM
jgi:hypothetical protein